VSTTTIAQALTGERVVALSPETADEAATGWTRRPNLFPGRPLTVATLGERPRWQAGHLAQRGQAFAPGVARGLTVGHVVEGVDDVGRAVVALKISEGQGLTVRGEDVVLARPVECLLSDVPVVAPPAVFAGLLDADAQRDAEDRAVESADPRPGAPLPRAIGPTLGALLAAAPDRLPAVGVLVLQPVTVDTADFDSDDPCDRCPCDDGMGIESFEDWRIADGVRLLWYAWPQEWLALPLGSRRRNELAYRIFETEGSLSHGEALPWERWGVPIALVGVDAQWRPHFVDRASVVREGGRARDPRLQLATAGSASLAANSRLPALWQARIEQFAEEVAAAGDPAPAADVLARRFARLPPFGLLPKNAIDPENLRSEFFPSGFDIDAVPIPLDQLDVALRASAGQAPLNLSNAESVRVLVPVPHAVWEPRLLLRESVAPEFQETLDRFLLARARALGGRQGLRHKQAVLTHAIDGTDLDVPEIDDDPDALEIEGLAPWGPPPTGGGHRSSVSTEVHQHRFEDATGTLVVAAGDRLYAWVCLDPDNVPSTLMFQWRSGDWEHRAYWGEDLIDEGEDGAASRRRMGDLPAAGEWQRLEVLAADVGLEGDAVNGMAFTLFGGRAAYAAAGKADASGVEQEWFRDQLPAGAVEDGNEPWDWLSENDLWAPFEASYSVVPTPTGAGDDKRIGRVEEMGDLVGDPSLGALSSAELANLSKLGLEGFIAYLTSRADRADDIVDYGFVKVQTDIYRIRQLMLGTTAAAQLAVSPALATIAQADTAVASQSQIASFLNDLKAKVGEPAAKSSPTGTTAAGAKAVTKAPLAQVFADARTVGDFGASTSTSAKLVQAKSEISPIFKRTQATPFEIANMAPLIGTSFIRTTAIAERLKEPRANEARDYATSSRSEAVRALLRLADALIAEDGGETPGLFIDVELHGLENDPFLDDAATKAARKRLFTDFIAPANRAKRLADLLKVPARMLPNGVDPDEAAHFSDTADLSDNVVALMRQMEGRIKLYRDAISVCRSVLDRLKKDAGALLARITVVTDVLAEARHDVSVARALLAEETDRVEDINARRASVLEQDVRFLAFVRSREVDNLLTAPRCDLDPGLIDAPVPACLKDHADVPEELQDMLQVVREAPAAWFVGVPKLLDRLDRSDMLLRTLQSAQVRTQVKALGPPLGRAATQNKVAAAIARVAARQAELLGTRVEALQRLNLANLATATWKGVRDQATQLVSLGDLIEGAHGRGPVAGQAAAEYERIGRIAACLHAEFSGVLPSIRLDWAETLSEFDAAPNLRNLGSLARWSEIGYVDRRQMQSYVDWLFAQMDPRQAQGESMMNDVVRMCLLLASHAPVDRIISGRMKRPVTGVRPGVRLPLAVFDPGRLRIGMQALMFRGASVVARATVEDIGGAEVSARVVHTSAAQLDLGEDVRVHFSDTTAVSLGSVRTMMSRTLWK